jgi:prephenate dehydrogenase
MSTAEARPRRAAVVGVGVVGGSIGLALRRAGWWVHGWDSAPGRAAEAVARGILDTAGPELPADIELTFIATPVGSIAACVVDALASTEGLVTDVGSVKAPLLHLMDDPRFVGGHPMAGSELDGLDGARATLFEGATWVLTPVPGTDDAAFAAIRTVIASFGADVVALPPADHDAMVAAVSHVPHLTAATLMRLADDRADEHRALLRLAAGGFRDMTRIAAGHPGIWPDICAENRTAIVAELDRLIVALGEVRAVVQADERDQLTAMLDQARRARLALPAGVATPDELCELRVPVADRAGVLAQITTLASELDVSIADIEIAHAADAPQGVLILLVDAAEGPRLADALGAAGYRPALRSLT